jgi:uncharacterized protein involved in exopolysaccharide biosynthesis
MAAMEERSPTEPREDEIDLGKYVAILRKEWWKIALVSLAVGVATLLVMLTRPNVYQATAIVTPATEDGRPGASYGSFASFGFNMGGPSRLEELETLFTSNDLAVRVVNQFNLWPVLLGKDRKPSGDWDAIHALKGGLEVTVKKKSNTIAVSFRSRSADDSTNILKCVLEGAKTHLQEAALKRANSNKEFIEGQIARTVDPLTRDRLYTLYGQEVEREMMARNREQFGFRVVDSPRAPDRKFGPARVMSAIKAALLAFFLSCGYFVIRRKR